MLSKVKLSCALLACASSLPRFRLPSFRVVIALAGVMTAMWLTSAGDFACAQEPADAQASVALELVSVAKISDSAPHSAFTDLIWHDGFYCVFREGARHVSEEASIRVLYSPDGGEWNSVAEIAVEGIDLRDAKISVTPSGKLALLCGAAEREGSGPATRHRNFLYTSSNGRDWDGPQEAARENTWLWRITWHGEDAYGVGYEVAPQKRAAKEYGTTLWRGRENAKMETIIEPLFTENGPTESTLRFGSDETLYCLQRRDGRPTNTAILGHSRPPYQDWTWRDLGAYYGGPNFLQVTADDAQAWIAGGRLHVADKGSRTVLCELDVDDAKLIPLLELPSGGDTSYPGLVWRENRLYVSYYSSHEGKTSIYFAEVKVTAK